MYGSLLVDGSKSVDAFIGMEHERGHEEDVHGFVAVTEIVEADEGLKAYSRVGYNLIGGRFLICLYVQKWFEDRKDEVLVVHTSE